MLTCFYKALQAHISRPNPAGTQSGHLTIPTNINPDMPGQAEHAFSIFTGGMVNAQLR
jgi:hypothetical protein